MNRILRVYQWVLLSIILQAIVYLFINNIYLSNRGNIVEKVKFIPTASVGNESPIQKEPEISVPLPKGAKNIKISYDKSYAAFINDGKLEIVDIKAEIPKRTIHNVFPTSDPASKNKAEAFITSYQWLPDRNTLIYALSTPENASPQVQMATYDVDSDGLHTGVTMGSNYLPYGSQVTDLVISPLNMIIYAKVKVSPTQARFYRINIMNDIYHSMTVDIGTLAKIGRYSETLVYQNNENRLFRKSGMYNTAVQLQLSNKMALLDIISQVKEGKGRDIVYAGELNEDGKVASLYFGNIEAAPSEWTSLQLKRPFPAKDIFIGSTGTTYGFSEVENAVYGLETDRKTEFSGKFVGIADGHVAYMDGNLLKFKPIN